MGNITVHQGRDLSHQDFRDDMPLIGVSFISCDLSNANFDGRILLGCWFLSCKMDDTKFNVTIDDSDGEGFHQTLFCGSNLEDSTFDTSKHLLSSHTDSRRYIGDYPAQVKEYGCVYNTVSTKKQRQNETIHIQTSATDPIILGLRGDGKRIDDVHLVYHKGSIAFYYKDVLYDAYDKWEKELVTTPTESSRWYNLEHLSNISRRTRTNKSHIASMLLMFAAKKGLTYIISQLNPNPMMLEMCFEHAVKHNNMESVMYLKDCTPIIDRYIICAARLGHLKLAMYMVSIYGNNKAVMSTAMREAGKNGHKDTFEFFVSMGGDTNCDWYMRSVKDELKERFL